LYLCIYIHIGHYVCTDCTYSLFAQRRVLICDIRSSCTNWQYWRHLRSILMRFFS